MLAFDIEWQNAIDLFHAGNIADKVSMLHSFVLLVTSIYLFCLHAILHQR
jgi:hypothetical protein